MSSTRARGPSRHKCNDIQNHNTEIFHACNDDDSETIMINNNYVTIMINNDVNGSNM